MPEGLSLSPLCLCHLSRPPLLVAVVVAGPSLLAGAGAPCPCIEGCCADLVSMTFVSNP